MTHTKTAAATAREMQRKLRRLGADATVYVGSAAREWGSYGPEIAAVLISDEAVGLHECCGLLGLLHGCATTPTPRIVVDDPAFFEFENSAVVVFYREG